MTDSSDDDVTVETTAEECAALEEEDSGAAAAPEPKPAAVGQPRTVAVALAAILAVSAGLACWLYLSVYRVDQRVSPEAEQAAVAAAADGATALLTYAPKTLEKDFAAAESHLTGDFLAYYTEFTKNVVTPAAQQKGVRTVASVVSKGIVSMRPNKAEVLIFVNQTTVSTANPDGSYSMSSVKVGLENHDGRWLISSFDPV